LLGEDGEAVVGKAREWLQIGSTAAQPTATPDPPRWPEPVGSEAYYGLAGEIVRAIEPHTESDPVALLVQILIEFGNVVGRSAHATVEADPHYTNEFAVIVGKSSKARKGTSRGRIHRLFECVDSDWADNRNQSGLASGEGLIWAVRDPIEKRERIKERGETARYETVVADEGVADKRLLVYEPEFASVLKQTERQGSTLSTMIRQAWETGKLRTLTKNSPARSTGAHISIVGHITADELRRYLTATESANGFANRFLWIAVRRSRLLPDGGGNVNLTHYAAQLRSAVEYARTCDGVRRDVHAGQLWHEIYGDLSADRPGLAGALLGRAEAHTLRLSVLYALLDRSAIIRTEHLMAALAVWDYAERSVRYLFGDGTGDPLADDLLRCIRGVPSGISRTDLSGYLGRHTPAGRLDRALGILLDAGRVTRETRNTGGRPVEIWTARD
jgi:hypothetical protein